MTPEGVLAAVGHCNAAMEAFVFAALEVALTGASKPRWPPARLEGDGVRRARNPLLEVSSVSNRCHERCQQPLACAYECPRGRHATYAPGFGAHDGVMHLPSSEPGVWAAGTDRAGRTPWPDIRIYLSSRGAPCDETIDRPG